MLRKTFYVLTIIMVLLLCNITFAVDIKLNDDDIEVNSVKLSGENIEGVFLSKNMNNGGSDDEALKSNIEVNNVITISKAGEYIFTGNLSDGQIAIDANQIVGDVKIILDNANIECKNAPAIFVYCKDINNDKCNVIISPKEGTENEIKGGKIKVDAMNFKNQDEILYYIEKDTDETGEYYERYKYDGAISSDISITFDGKGKLKIISTAKEGIESKMNITINDGEYVINSLDDAINAAADKKSVITINGGKVVAYLLHEAEEGDGIDSNGYIYINGGTVYCFSCPGADNGLDSELGTYINGGEVFSIGSMNDNFIISNSINSVRATFRPEINTDEYICVADENENIVFGIKADRKIGNFFYTSEKLEKGKSYNVYTNITLNGETNEYNMYNSYISGDFSNAVKNEFTDIRPNFIGEFNEEKNIFIPIIALIFASVLFIIMLIVDMRDDKTSAKLKVVNLVMGIIIGCLLVIGIYMLNPVNSRTVNRINVKYENNIKRPDELNRNENMNRPQESIPNNDVI